VKKPPMTHGHGGLLFGHNVRAANKPTENACNYRGFQRDLSLRPKEADLPTRPPGKTLGHRSLIPSG